MGKSYLTKDDLQNLVYSDVYKTSLIEYFADTKHQLIVKMNGGRFVAERIFPDGAFVGVRFTDYYAEEKFKLVCSWAALHLVKIRFNDFIDGDLIRQHNWQDVKLLNE